MNNKRTETAPRICAKCGKEFAQYHARSEQKLCPTCVDERDRRPSVAIKRELLTCFAGVRVVSLPDEWHPFTATGRDEKTYKIDVSGKKYGKSWDGRIVMYAPRPVVAGDVVKMRHMRVYHRVKAVYGKVPLSGSAGLNGEPEFIMKRTRLPVTADDPEAIIEVENYEYVVLEPVPGGEAVCDLVWEEITLPSPSDRERSSIEGAPLWEMRLRGTSRDGALRGDFAVGVLAVVSHDHPLVVTRSGESRQLP